MTARSQRKDSRKFGRSRLLTVSLLLLVALLAAGGALIAQPAAPPGGDAVAPAAPPAPGAAPAAQPAPTNPDAPAPADAPAADGAAVAGDGSAVEDPNAPADANAPGAASAPTTTSAPTSSSAPSTEATSEPVAMRPVLVNGRLVLNFQKAPTATVLNYLSEATGLIILKGEDAIQPVGTITLISKTPVTIDEAINLLDSVLKERDLAAIRIGRQLKIVTAAQAKKEFTPVRVNADPNQIPITDRIVTQIIPIKTVDATKLKADLASIIPTTVDVTTNALSNTIILTGTESSIHRIALIIQGIDVQSEVPMKVEVFQLKYVTASSAAKLITDIFKEDQPTGAGGAAGNAAAAIRNFMGGGAAGGGRGGFGGGAAGGGRGGFGGGAPGGGAAAANTDAGSRRVSKVVASSDDRTNTLVVSGPPDLLKVIEGVVAELDKNPVPAPIVTIIPVKNGVAADIAGTLNSAFMGGGTSGGTRTTGSTSLSPFGGASSSFGGASTFGAGSRGGGTRAGGGGGGMNTGFGSTGSTGGAGQRGGGGFGGATGGGFAGGGARIGGTGTGAIAAPTDLIGQVSFVADVDTNSLVVTATEQNLPRVLAIIAQLDRPVPQVLIKVLIAEVSHDNSLDLGVEFSAMNLRVSGNGFKIGTDFGVAKQIPFGTSPNSGGFFFTLNEENVIAAIHALASKSALDVLSRPYILTGDNQLASIMVGQSVPFITNSTISDTGQVNNTIVYNDIGIILNVTPHINPVGIVTLDVAPQISALTSTEVPISSTVGAPVIDKRAAQARVAIRDGQTIVIGGLMGDQITNHVDKVPFLGDIPLLGLLFQHSTTVKNKTELLIFLTPHVAQQPDELKGMSEDELAGAKILKESVDPAAVTEHIKSMSRGAASHPAPRDADYVPTGLEIRTDANSR